MCERCARALNSSAEDTQELAVGTHTADPVTSIGTFLFIIAVAISAAWRRAHLSTASFYAAVAVAWHGVLSNAFRA